MPRSNVSRDVSQHASGGTIEPLRIIVVDDDRDAVLTLMMVLKDEGHHVKGVYKGADVLPAVERFDPDVVVLDINMPDMSGYEVSRAIRGQSGEARPLLIAISGVYTNGADKILATLTGFNHHLAKPFDPNTLLSLLAPLSHRLSDPAHADVHYEEQRLGNDVCPGVDMGMMWGSRVSIAEAFQRNPDGTWECIASVTLNPPSGRIQVTPGSRFAPGTTFMGVDLARWLEEQLKKR